MWFDVRTSNSHKKKRTNDGIWLATQEEGGAEQLLLPEENSRPRPRRWTGRPPRPCPGWAISSPCRCFWKSGTGGRRQQQSEESKGSQQPQRRHGDAWNQTLPAGLPLQPAKQKSWLESEGLTGPSCCRMRTTESPSAAAAPSHKHAFIHLFAHSIGSCVRTVIAHLLDKTSSSRTLVKWAKKKKPLETSDQHPDMRGEHPPAYLADGTHAFPFSTQAFAGIGAQLPVFAVGALVTVHGVMAADTLTARDPLRGRREEERLKA